MTESDQHFIYILAHKRDDGLLYGPCKVGITNNVGSRVSGLQTGNPVEIGFVFSWNAEKREIARSVERAFHLRFAGKRLQGEWFNVDPIFAMVGMCNVLLDELDFDVGLSSDMVKAWIEHETYGPTEVRLPI